MKIRIKHWRYWPILFSIAFVLMTGGCGGDGGGSSGASEGEGGAAPDIDFYALSGTWVARDGTGTFGTFQLRLRHGSGTINVLSVNAGEAEVIMNSNITWDVFSNNFPIDVFHQSLNNQLISLSRVGSNRFRFTYPEGRAYFTVISNTIIHVEERGSLPGFTYQISYYMDKQ